MQSQQYKQEGTNLSLYSVKDAKAKYYQTYGSRYFTATSVHKSSEFCVYNTKRNVGWDNRWYKLEPQEVWEHNFQTGKPSFVSKRERLKESMEFAHFCKDF